MCVLSKPSTYLCVDGFAAHGDSLVGAGAVGVVGPKHVARVHALPNSRRQTLLIYIGRVYSYI